MRIAGRSQGLPPPQALHPISLYTTAFTAPTNEVALAAGQALLVPAGMWLVSGGALSGLQWLDPVQQQWQSLTNPGTPWEAQLIADSFNYRVINLSGVATGATVSAPGSDYLEETTMVNPSVGNSRWRAVIGGAVGTINIGEPGANYTVAPIVIIGRPPSPGVPAAATATISTGGAVTAITITQPGAGYNATPQILLIPSTTDPNFSIGRIRQATATAVLSGEGTVTAVLLQNFGAPQASAPTLNIAGQGTGATATVLPAAWVAPADDLILMQPAGVV